MLQKLFSTKLFMKIDYTSLQNLSEMENCTNLINLKLKQFRINAKPIPEYKYYLFKFNYLVLRMQQASNGHNSYFYFQRDNLNELIIKYN